MYLQKVISKKTGENIFVGILKVTDKKSRIRSRIQIRYSEVLIRGSGFGPVQKWHASGPQIKI
jgi:hypothetical protein